MLKLGIKQHILISRIDAIGDIVLTLPMCRYIKVLYPDASISFLAKTYTLPVLKCSNEIDCLFNFDDLVKLSDDEQIAFFKSKNIDAIIHVFPNKHLAQLAKKAKISLRIGTRNRLYHWLTCNILVKLSRKNSTLHEAQLNLCLLRPLGLKTVPELLEIKQHFDLKPTVTLSPSLNCLLIKNKFNLLIHPKSNGSGAEWSLDSYEKLIQLLPPEKFNIIITGSEKEKQFLKDWINALPAHVIDATGLMNLDEFIAFIYQADGLIAAGTGPLHLASALGINTLGLFPSVRPIHPGRWAPLGKRSEYLESGTDILETITAFDVYERIKNWHKP